MKKNILSVMLFALSAVAFAATSCNSDDNDNPATPTPRTKKVKYEITGNYTGSFRVVYGKPEGDVSLIVSEIPWSVEVTMTTPASAVLVTTHASGTAPGTAGQTATANIYINNQVVKTSTQTADADGYIFGIPSLGAQVQ